jgi:hypothetical protein
MDLRKKKKSGIKFPRPHHIFIFLKSIMAYNETTDRVTSHLGEGEVTRQF